MENLKDFNTDNGIDSGSVSPKLNINANAFVPRFGGDDEPVRPAREPKLMLPWKGFPKRVQQKTPCETASVGIAKPSVWLRAEPVPSQAANNPVLEQKPIRANWRQRERTEPVEAVKLVEQRRKREPLNKAEGSVHLTRDPVNISPSERVDVARLRMRKLERIELALQDQKVDELVKKIKEVNIDKQPTQQPDSNPESKLESKPEAKPTMESSLPKRYIPTNKQWDERCKAKALEAQANKAANKGNTIVGISKVVQKKSDVETVSSSVKHADTAEPGSMSLPDPHPETRRGNLIHARSIWRAFGNRGLLPTPSPGADPAPATQPESAMPAPKSDKAVCRYAIEELLKLEPKANQLEKPVINEAFRKFLFQNE